jgi:hypothetical protein
VEHVEGDIARADDVTVAQLRIDRDRSQRSRRKSDPARLFVQRSVEREVTGVEQRRAVRPVFQIRQGTDVIEMGMRVNKARGAQSALGEQRDDLIDVVAAVDDDRFAALLVTDDGAVACKRTNREVLDDHDVVQAKSR